MTELNADQVLQNAIRDGIREGVKSKLTGYNSPLDKLIQESLSKHEKTLRDMLSDAIASCVGNEEFRQQIAESTRHLLAKTLVQRFVGEIYKQVNVLKSDPTTRARITIAIEEIVKSSKS